MRLRSLFFFRFVTTDRMIELFFFATKHGFSIIFHHWLRALFHKRALFDMLIGIAIGKLAFNIFNCDNCRVFCQKLPINLVSTALLLSCATIDVYACTKMVLNFRRWFQVKNTMIRRRLFAFILWILYFRKKLTSFEFRSMKEAKSPHHTPSLDNFQCKFKVRFDWGGKKTAFQFLHTNSRAQSPNRTIAHTVPRRGVNVRLMKRNLIWNYRHRWGNCVWERLQHTNNLYYLRLKCVRKLKWLLNKSVPLTDYVPSWRVVNASSEKSCERISFR